jgi:hypothetical protein
LVIGHWDFVGQWDLVIGYLPTDRRFLLPRFEPQQLPLHEFIVGLKTQGLGFEARGFGGIAAAEMDLGQGVEVGRVIGLGGDGFAG